MSSYSKFKCCSLSICCSVQYSIILSEIFEFANNISPFLDKRVKYKSLSKILFSMYCKRTHFDNKTTIVAPFSLPADSKGIDLQ